MQKILIVEDDKKIEISSNEKNDKVILYIKDNGIGIKAGEITRVFERGFTGENGRIMMELYQLK